jgi:hypothetical protein
VRTYRIAFVAEIELAYADTSVGGVSSDAINDNWWEVFQELSGEAVHGALELFDLFLGHSASSIETVATSGTAHVLYEDLDET